MLVSRPADLRRERRDDSGLALVVALLVTMISFILVTAVLAQAMHNVTQSGYLRRRTAAIHAAEAGLNWFSNLLENAMLGQLTSGWSPPDANGWRTRTTSYVATAPDRSTFTIRVKYTAADVCATTPCSSAGLAAQALTNPFPPLAYAIVRSIGTAGVDSQTGQTCSAGSQNPGCVTRVLESAIRLHSETGGIDSGTGVLGTSICFGPGGDLWVYGSLHVLDIPGPAPSYVSCAASGIQVGSGNSITIIDGDLYVDDAGVSVDNGGDLFLSGMVWAEGAVSLGGSGGNMVDECGSSTICVEGDAIGSSVTIGSGAAVLGELVECDPACPPTEQTFPKLTTDATLWANLTPLTAASGTAALALATTATTPTVIRITSVTSPACDTDFSGYYTINTDVTIVSYCKFIIDSQAGPDHILGSGTLSLVSAWPGTAAAPGTVTCTGSQDITVSNNPEIVPPIFLYTPCVMVLENNQSPLQGQLAARWMEIRQTVKIKLTELLGDQATVPGFVSGFRQDVRYINEITLAQALGL